MSISIRNSNFNALENENDVIKLIQETISDPKLEGDAFYVIDLNDVHQKYVKWITSLPRVEPHYAIKCNGDKMLLKLLAYLGAGFDCASKHEIQTILDLGVSPDRIIYANPCKQASYIKYAHRVGVNTMTFDNENELYKIKANHPNAKVVLRIITNDMNAVFRLSVKYGADMATSYKLIDLALQLNLNLIGISFHVGSGQMSASVFSESIQNARILFDYAAQKHNFQMNFLDLGGGYPGSSDSVELFATIAKEINKSLDEYFPADAENKVRIIAEPGRYFPCSAFTMCVNVIAKRVIDDIDGTKSFMYYINDGIFGHFSNVLLDPSAVSKPFLLKNIDSKTPTYRSFVWGPTCDQMDTVFSDILLPELSIGDYLAIPNMGAYTSCLSKPYNGIQVNVKFVYINTKVWSEDVITN